jgi:uncharacterized membrane protein YdjX (TVP38/TMEM64 family)
VCFIASNLFISNLKIRRIGLPWSVLALIHINACRLEAVDGKMRMFLTLLILLAFGAYFYFDLEKFLNLEYVQSQLDILRSYRSDHFGFFTLIFSLSYAAVIALSIPGAIILTLTSGAVFGLFWGVIIASFASSFGATLAFLFSRFLLRDWVGKKFKRYLALINKGLEKEGLFYLFSIRMIPLFPFFAVNLLMGLTSISTRSFYLVSQAGMLLGTIAYVNAGSELSQITSLSGLISIPIIMSLIFLGLLPLIAKYTISYMQRRSHEKIC